MKLLMFCVFVLSVGYTAATASCMKENVEIEVTTAVRAITASPNDHVTLPCDYSISIGEDLPVTITWSTGDGLQQSDPVFQCKGFTKDKSCRSFEYLDGKYVGRIDSNDLPSLSLNVAAGDTNNYWCNVTLEDAINVELGMDMKGDGLTIDGEIPKLNFVEVGQNVESDPGTNVTLSCECVDSTQCEDVGWFKGSIQGDMQTVITRKTYFRPVPTEIKAYGDWNGRVELDGLSLTITNLRESDSGRYWCEVRDASYKGIGPMAIDSESLILNVDTFTCPSNVFSADPKDCTKYYVCDHGMKHHMSCPPTTVFDDQFNICNWP